MNAAKILSRSGSGFGGWNKIHEDEQRDSNNSDRGTHNFFLALKAKEKNGRRQLSHRLPPDHTRIARV
jgi:hypothetical protein